MYIVKGFGNTIVITIFAVMLGIVLGFLIAIVRTSHDRNGGLAILNGICKAYLTIIRGTPVMIQLLIIYYVVLASVTNKILVAVIAFGLNSAAYVAEIVRSGIMSVDIGQFEAGRSLGLNYRQTMKLVIIPQAVKNILPALLNELSAPKGDINQWLYWYDGSDKGWRYHTKQHIRGIYTAYCCSPYLSGYSDAFKPRSKQT